MDSLTTDVPLRESNATSEKAPLLNRHKWYRRLFGGGWQYQYPQKIRHSISIHSFDQTISRTRSENEIIEANTFFDDIDAETEEYVIDAARFLKEQSRKIRLERTSESSNVPDLKQVFEELETPSNDAGKNIRIGTIAVLIHLAVGISAMVILEGWHPRDAAYFCIVTITTVGYGDLSPTTEKSKIFVMIYVVVSIGLVASYLSYFVGIVLDEQEQVLFQNKIEQRQNEIENRLRNDLDAQILHSTQAYDSSDVYHLVFSFSYLVIIFGIGLATFMKFEGLGLVDAMYLIIISASTVGFGDQHPQHPVSRYLMMIWLVFATVSAANVVGEITRIRMKSIQRSIARRILTVPIDKRSLYALDRNHTGTVSWGDFLEKMAVTTGQMEQRDIEMYRKRFQTLNPDLNGLVRVESGFLK